MIITTSTPGSIVFTCSRSWTPSILGIFTSMKITSGRSPGRAASTSSPLLAVKTW